MSSSRIVSAAGCALVALAAAVAASAGPSVAPPTKIFEIGSIAAVQNGASAPSILTTTKPWTVRQIWTYHWNSAKGATPGTIGLRSLSTQKTYGPWRAIGTAGQGGVPNAYWHVEVNFLLPPGGYRILDSSPATWSQNSETGGRGMAFVMATPAAELAWPALPDATVPVASVSNGCGGEGWASVVATENYIGNTSAFKDSNVNPLAKSYTVSFVDACNLHDAGYAGAKVHDAINGGVVDYFGWNQKRVDGKFLADMRTLCDRQVAATATVARANCRARGGWTSIGALSRFDLVTRVGHLFWGERPVLTGVWAGPGSGADAARLELRRDARFVTGTWHSGTGESAVKGEFRGTLITRAKDTLVKGFSKTTKGDVTVMRPMSISFDPKTPDEIAVAGPGIAGSLTRS